MVISKLKQKVFLRHVKDSLIEEHGISKEAAEKLIQDSFLPEYINTEAAQIGILHDDVYNWAKDLLNGKYDRQRRMQRKMAASG